MAQNYIDEEAILEKTLNENNIKYEHLGSTFWVYSDAYPEKRKLVITTRRNSETWNVMECRNGDIWHSYEQYVKIVLSMVVKFKNGEPY